VLRVHGALGSAREARADVIRIVSPSRSVQTTTTTPRAMGPTRTHRTSVCRSSLHSIATMPGAKTSLASSNVGRLRPRFLAAFGGSHVKRIPYPTL
jgi:hypothetical protein